MRSPVPRLRLRQIVRKGEAFHFARFDIRGENPGGFHGHDFGEVFWIESGAGAHLLPGRRQALAAGDLVFIRPRDRHGLRSRGGAAMRMVNVAFPAGTLSALRARYFPRLRDAFWRPGARPRIWRMEREGREWLEGAARRLAFGARDRFAVELFLMELLDRFVSRLAPAHAGLPEWLERACAGVRDLEAAREGVAGFVRLCGRSPEHVARVARLRLGCTPTEYVNRVRAGHAARLLETTDRSVLDIAQEVGFESQAHFTRLFSRFHHLPPLRYRRRHRRLAV